MADSLNLATLNVAIQSTGVSETQREVENLTSSVRQSGDATQQSTNSMRGSFGNLSSSITGTINNTQIFGTTLGDLRNQLSSGEGATALLQGAVTGLTSALINMAMQALQSAISGLKDFISNGVEAASDLQEVQNVIDVAFGESAEEVNEWAQTTASAYGLTELQAKEYASTLGAMFSGMDITGQQAVRMSEQMAQLTGDLASFNNLDYDEAFGKIKAGLTGEMEPLKSLGVIMNETNLSAFAMSQGLTTAYSAMSESDKVLLRYNYLITKTSNAHEDFYNTQDSYSNVSKSMENNMTSLSTTLGAQLLPVLTNVKVIINNLLEALSPIVSLIGTLVGGLINTLVNSIKPIIDIVTTLIKVLNPIITVIDDIISKFVEFISVVGDKLTTVVSTFAEKMGLVQDSTAETVEYTTETIIAETENALGYVDTAVDKWVDDQTKKYREKLESRYGDTLGSAVKIEKLTQQYEERRRSMADSYTDAYKRSQEDLTRGTKTEIDKQYSLYEEYYSKLTKLFSGVKSADTSGVIGMGGSGTITRPGYATGTAYHPGGLAMVGENGRELINLPRGSRVYTNRETENMMSGGNSGQVINNPTYYATIDAKNVKDFVDVTNAFNGYTQNVRMGV